MKKKFPKKAKLIANGFYRIIDIDKFTAQIYFPIVRSFKIAEPQLDHYDTFSFNLVFAFDRVYKGYAEYRQTDCIQIKEVKI